MNLPPAVADHKTILAALIAIAHTAAARLGIDGLQSIVALAAHLEISRPHIYDRARRILDAIEPIARLEPGRPPATRQAAPQQADAALTIAVLHHRLEHLDAMVVSPTGARTAYSVAFRRFTLEQHDAWPADRTLDDFAAAVEVPLDTVRDWIAADRAGLTPELPTPRPIPPIPVEASNVTRQIAEAFAAWTGSTRDFIRQTTRTISVLPAQIVRILLLLGLVLPHRPRSLPGPPRYRGETTAVSPGAMLVSDGHEITIELVGSGRLEKRMWQPMVDQASECIVGSVVGLEETADGAVAAYADALAFLGGRAPEALLLDGRTCYDAPHLLDAIAPTKLIRSTPERPQNNAVLEGTFGKYQDQVGTLRFDDSSPEAMVTSAVREVQRAYAAGINHAARAELNGMSRAAYLREFVPSPEQRARDLRFLEQLAADHQRPRSPRLFSHSREMLDAAFHADPMLRGKDARGHLRRHLARFHPDAIRLGLAQFRACGERREIDARYAHRYLAGIIRNVQNELELQRAESELLDLARQHHQLWTADLERDQAEMLTEHTTPCALLHAFAQRAALGGLPVEGAYWTEQLMAGLREHPECAPAVRRYLVRLFEAPEERRLVLLDRIARLAHGLN